MKRQELRGTAMRLVSLVCLSTFITSCIIGYADYPKNMVGHPPQSKPFDTLYYQINDDAVFVTRSKSTLRRIFREESLFKKTEKVDEMPRDGVYCLVDVKWKAVGGASAFFGYLSYVFLLLIPVYSGKEGYKVSYHLYVDGEEKKTFEYDITRKMAMWAGLLPFIWVNWLTTDEHRAFEATAYRFFEDARPILAKI